MEPNKEFLIQLEKRAQEQRRLIKENAKSKTFQFVSTNIGQHPWRYIIPFALLLSLVLELVLGSNYKEFILGLFGTL